MPDECKQPHGVIFLTCPPEFGRGMLERVLHQFPHHRWTVYLRDEHREALASQLEGLELHRDKPTGSRLRFLWEIRQRHYALAVCAWQGESCFNRMKLVALLSGAARKLVFNENLDRFELRWERNPIWLRHLKWRLRGVRRSTALPFGNLLKLYTWTLGLALGSLRIWWSFVRYQARRLMNSC